MRKKLLISRSKRQKILCVQGKRSYVYINYLINEKSTNYKAASPQANAVTMTKVTPRGLNGQRKNDIQFHASRQPHGFQCARIQRLQLDLPVAS